MAVIAKCVTAPPVTTKALLEPVVVPLVAVSVKLPVFVMVTACAASTPFVNAAVVSGASG